MHLGIAIWPPTSAGWIELALGQIAGAQLSSLGGSGQELPLVPIDLLVVDGDQPGPRFPLTYRDHVRRFGEPTKVVLGSPESPFAMVCEWEPRLTTFLPKPYRVEELKDLVLFRFEELARARSSLRTPLFVAGGPTPGSFAGPPPAPVRSGIALGYLSSLRLEDLLQMLCLSAWTGRVVVQSLAADNLSGSIYINVGVVIHAESGRLNAEEACYAMLQWGRCEFRFVEEHSPVVQTIRCPWQNILLEGARRLDERRSHAGSVLPKLG